MAVMPVLFDVAGSARVAGLRYVDDRTTPGIRRVGRRPPFRYVNAHKRPIRDARELESSESIGRKAGERAVARLGARKLATQRARVLFAPEVAPPPSRSCDWAQPPSAGEYSQV